MKTLIVYYSRTGVTKKVAEILKARLANLTHNCDLEEITDTKNRQGPIGYMLSGREAMKKITPVIKPLTKNVADYDLVIVGTPVWAFTMSSPIRTFLTEQKDKFKKVAFFVTMGGSGQEKTFQNMAEIINQQPLATLDLKTVEVMKENIDEKINEYVAKLS
jgi:flavodoxin